MKKLSLYMGREVAEESRPAQIGFHAPRFAPADHLGKGGQIVEEDGQSHLLTIAPTGAGKGRNMLIPNLLGNQKGLTVVVDIKGELAAVTRRHRDKFGPTYVVDPYRITTQQPDCLNPIGLLDHVPSSVEEKSYALAKLIVGDTSTSMSGKDGRFWDETAFNLLTGVCGMIFQGMGEECRNVVQVRKSLCADDTNYQLAVLLDTIGKDIPPFAYQEIAAFLQTPDNTRGSILISAQVFLRFLGDPAVGASLSGANSFSVADFVEGKPMTIYLVLPPDKLYAMGGLLRLWVGSLLQLVVSRRKLPEYPSLFLLDEAAQLGTLDDLRTAVTLMRGYGLRLWSFWQDLSQLERLYPSDWQTIVNNADAIQTFGVTTHLMAKGLSNMLGVASPEELLNMPPDRLLLYQRGGKKRYVQKLDYLTCREFKGRFDPHPMYGAKRKGHQR